MSEIFPPIQLYALLAAASGLLAIALRAETIGAKFGRITTVVAYIIALIPSAQILIATIHTITVPRSPALGPYESWTLGIHLIAIVGFGFLLVSTLAHGVQLQSARRHLVSK